MHGEVGVKESRIQIRIAVIGVAILIMIFWTVPRLTEQEPTFADLLWLQHDEAYEMSQLSKVDDEDRDASSRIAIECGSKKFSVYSDVNGLQTVYWEERISDELKRCLVKGAEGRFHLIRNAEASRPYRPPYIVVAEM